MQKIILFSVLSLCLFAWRANAQEVINSNWPKGNTVCDGQLDEWDNPLRFYQNSLQYDITNDSSHIYIGLKALEQATSMKLMHGGLKIWFNTKGKKKETSSIALVRPLPTENSMPQFQPGDQPNKEKMDQLFVADKKVIEVKGFSNLPDGTLAVDNSEGIRAAVGMDKDKHLVYEFAVPLQLLKDKDAKNEDFSKAVAIEFEIAGLKMPSGGRPGAPEGEGGESGGGRGGHGGMGGGPGGMGGGMGGPGGQGGPGGMGGGRGGFGAGTGMGGAGKQSSTDHIWNKVKINLNKQ